MKILKSVSILSFFLTLTLILKSQDVNSDDTKDFREWANKIQNPGLPNTNSIESKPENQFQKKQKTDLEILYEKSNEIENTDEFSYDNKDIPKENQHNYKNIINPKSNKSTFPFDYLIGILIFLAVVVPIIIYFKSTNLKNTFFTDSKSTEKNVLPISDNETSIIKKIEVIKELEVLKKSGAITSEEYNILKSKLL